MNAALKLLLENKMTQKQAAKAFNALNRTNVKAGSTSNAPTKKILITLLVVNVKIKFEQNCVF